jgi:hypothetical protein
MQGIKRFDFTPQEWYKPGTTEYEPHPGEGNPVQIGSGPAAVIPALQEAGSTLLPDNIHCPDLGMGRKEEEGEPEDLSGWSLHSLRR